MIFKCTVLKSPAGISPYYRLKAFFYSKMRDNFNNNYNVMTG